MANPKTITLIDGLPEENGSFILLMWDGTLVEGMLHVKDGQRVLTHYNATIPDKPLEITYPAGNGKVIGYMPTRPVINHAD